MNKLTKYAGLFLTGVLACMSVASCQDDFDAPGLDEPKATLQPNTTIAQLKAEYWNDDNNYIDTVGLAASGQHVIVSGRVISSDASGNIYKSLVIQDATGALAMSINANSLYTTYRVGQEVVVDVTNMYIGKYSTLQQLGFPDYSASYGWQATFMPLEFFKEHTQLNGLPQPEKVDTLTLSIAELSNDAATLQRFQSQLVRFNNVHFKEGGEVSFCTAHKENTNRTLLDANGNELIVRTSGYANFWSLKLPAESGDVVGILSSYLSSGSVVWQLVLRSPDDLLNFGNPTLPKGTETNPYDILDAVSYHSSNRTVSGWYTGYIVGAAKAGVENITSASDIQWSADEEGGFFLSDNTLVIGQTAEAHSLDDCVVATLPDGSALQKYGNLTDYPELKGRQIWINGSSATVYGTAGLETTGRADAFRIMDVTIPDDGDNSGSIPSGDGSEASPYNPTQVVSFGTDANQADKWVKGYIVGWVDSNMQNYGDANNCMFTTPATVATNVLLATTPDEKDWEKCCVVNLPTGEIRSAINLLDNPSNLGRAVSVYGTIRKYFNMPGVRDLTKYSLDGNQGGGDNPVNPGEAVTSLDESFASGSCPSGWTVKNVAGNKDWFFSNYGGRTFAACSAYNGTATGGQFESWLITPAIDMSGVKDKNLSFESMVGYSGNGALEVFAMTSADPSTATLTQLSANIPAPTGSWGDWVASGNVSLSQLSGTIYIGFRYKGAQASGYTTYRVTNVKLGQGGGGNTPDNPDTPTGGNTADLDALKTSSSYTNDVTTPNGWHIKNCAIQSGSDGDDLNPAFKFIGGSSVRAVCLNGKKGSEGIITSPTLTGGCKTLSFSYGFAFTESKCQFTVNVKQGGNVVKTQTVTLDSITQKQAYSFTMDVNVTGDFTIEIVNDAYSATDAKNTDRVSIWNISWTN
ncbi:MAG: DUF5689 domain-containing protein [Muribaculaceae bacterium]|nr:DUF5689 domain-containing protein [Muribaculaceae bacterium]